MMQLVLILKIYLIKKPVLLQAFAGGNVIPAMVGQPLFG